MIIVGAKGHAKEILQIIEENNFSFDTICFFDDISMDIEELLFNKYPIIKNMNEAQVHLQGDNRVILGVGNPIVRYKLAQKFMHIGGVLISVIASSTFIGKHEVYLGCGLNIMHNVLITNRVIIGEGALINAFASIHHNVTIGKYCEIAPGARILGNSYIGDFSAVGAGAIILPSVKLGSNVIIGAGAVVTKYIPDNSVAIGVPAKIIKNRTL